MANDLTTTRQLSTCGDPEPMRPKNPPGWTHAEVMRDALDRVAEIEAEFDDAPRG